VGTGSEARTRVVVWCDARTSVVVRGGIAEGRRGSGGTRRSGGGGVARPLQLAASVMALGKSGEHAGGDSPQASPPKATAKHVARVERSRQLVREAYPYHPPFSSCHPHSIHIIMTHTTQRAQQ
jgi:hypothetical protein